MSFRKPGFNIPIRNSVLQQNKKDKRDNNLTIVGNKSEKDFGMPSIEATVPAEQARQPKKQVKSETDKGINKNPKLNDVLKKVDKKRKPEEDHGQKCDSITKNKLGKPPVKVGDFNMNSSPRNLNQGLSLTTSSQNSVMAISQKRKRLDMLSQPGRHFSHKECLIWLQERRETGIWVQCNRLNCSKWRYLANVNDPADLPEKWYCEMNPKTGTNSCNAKEEQLNVADEEDLIHNKYTAGSVVWAKLSGHPWWPAMVDDCVDTEQYYWLDGFSDIPTHYNTVFFDSEEVTRAWITATMIKPYKTFGKTPKIWTCDKEGNTRYQSRIIAAKSQAEEALQLPIVKRLSKYSFIARYKGPINSPLKEGAFKKPRNQRIMKIHKNLKNFQDMERPPRQSTTVTYLGKTQSGLESSILHISHSQFMTKDKTMGNITKPTKELKVRLDRIMSSPDVSNIAINGDTIVKTFDFASNIDTDETFVNYDLVRNPHMEEIKIGGIINDSSIVPSSQTEVCDINFDKSPVLSQHSADFEF